MNTLCEEIPTLAQRPAPEGVGELGKDVRWHVLHTRSRQEKALAENCMAKGIQYFLPLVKVERVHGGHRTQIEFPLFPGYLFLRGTLEEVYFADRTKRVARVIPVFDQARLAEELRSVELAIKGADSKTRFDPFPYLKKGIRVEIVSGPMRGVRGVIEDRRKRDRLILQVNVLGQSTSLEVDSALLVPLDDQ